MIRFLKEQSRDHTFLCNWHMRWRARDPEPVPHILAVSPINELPVVMIGLMMIFSGSFIDRNDAKDTSFATRKHPTVPEGLKYLWCIRNRRNAGLVGIQSY